MCAELVQVAPLIEEPPALDSLFGLAALAPGVLLRLAAGAAEEYRRNRLGIIIGAIGGLVGIAGIVIAIVA